MKKSPRITHRAWLLTCALVVVVAANAARCETLQLRSGWQLFGAPDALSASGVQQALSENNCILYSLEGGAAPLDDPGAFKSLRGYWLFCPDDTTVQVEEAEDAAESVFIPLKQGWNIVTVPGARTLRPESLLRVGGRRLADTTDIRHQFYEYDPERLQYVRATLLQPWRAYFVFANADTQLEFIADSGSPEPGTLPDVTPFSQDTPVVSPQDGVPYVENQLVVSFGGSPPADPEAALRAAGLTPVGFDPDTGVYQAQASPGADLDQARDMLTRTYNATASKNYVLSVERTPDDVIYLAPPSPGAAWAYDAVGLPEIWDEHPAAASPVVAVVDTGVDATHPDLADRVLAGANFIAGGSGADTSDPNGHGTQVAGIIAAQGDNQTAIAGLCPGCRILPVKVCDATGRCPLYSVLNGLGYAASLRAPVVNISLGAAIPDDAARALFNSALATAQTNGSMVVAAAGNNNADASNFMPAALPQVISVGAVNESMQRAPFSNYGDTVDLAAPGAAVFTTTPGSGMAESNGTSLSAAFVSGLAAQMLAVFPEATAGGVRDAFTATARPLNTDKALGAGLIDANAAMRITQERLVGPIGINAPPRILSLAADPPAGSPATLFTLAVQAEDSNGDALRYAWTAPAGRLASPGAPLTTWDASGLPAGQYTLFVSVSDRFGASAMDVVQVTIRIAAGDALEIYPPFPVTTLDEPFPFTARVVQSDGGLARVTAQWRVADPAVGAVDASGVFHAAGVGETDIFAEYNGMTATAHIRVYDPLVTPYGNERAIDVPDEAIFALETASGGAWSWSETSEFMIGSVTVNVVFMESNGTIDANAYNWNPADMATAYQEIKDALNWWAAQEPRANLSFHVLPYTVFNTGYEPTNRPSTDDQLYINQYLVSKGYTTDYGDPVWNKLNRNKKLNDDLRTANGTEWAYTIYVTTGKPIFSDNYFGYAYLGGPYVMMTKDNDGWGLSQMDFVTAHETAHIFRAGDQYSGACTNCTKVYGYLTIPNNYCVTCNSVPSLMKCTALSADPSTRMQVGWRDSDGDNVFDPVDPSSGGSSSFTLSPPAATVTSGTSVDLTATILNFKGDTIPGATVTFTTTAGSIAPTPVRTGLPGTAETALTTVCSAHTVNASVPGTTSRQSDITGTCVNAPEPQNATATVNCPDVTISWTPGSDPSYDRYTVKRGTTSGGPYTQIATNISTTSYTDPNIPNGTYYYIVIAYKSGNPADQTGASNRANASPACGATPPSNLTATANCPDVNLTWTAASPAAYDRYTVKRGTTAGGPYTQIATNISTTSYTDSNPGDGTYYYIVIAYKSTNPADQTGASNETSVTLSCGATNGAPCDTSWLNFRCNLHHTGESTALITLPLTIKWGFDTGSDVDGSPAVANGRVYIGASNGKLYALDKNTGTKIWEFQAGSEVFSTPAVAGNAVYFGSFDRKVYALNESTGGKLWEFTTGDRIDSSPGVAGGTVFIGSKDGNLYALNANSGALLWKHSTGADVFSSPSIVDGKVFFGSDDRKLHALDETTGNSIWTFTANAEITSSPAVANGHVYCGSRAGSLYALNENTGAQIWEFTAGDHIDSSPAVGYGMVFVGSDDDKVYAVDENTGAKVWEFVTQGNTDSSPAVADGKVFIGSDDNYFYILDAMTGAKLWELNTGADVNVSPAVLEGVVYFGSDNDYVYAYDYQGTPPTATATVNCPDVVLSWTPAAPAYYDRYTVKRATISGGPYTQIATNLTSTTHTDTDPGNGTYYYVVYGYKSANPSDHSPDSNEIVATVTCSVTNGDACGANWPKFHCSNHNNGESSSALDVPLKVKWKFETTNMILGSPVINADKVFIGGGDNKMYALDKATGAKLWEFVTGNDIDGAAAVSGGRLFFASRDNKAYALDETTGAKLWEYALPNWSYSDVAVSGNIVYVPAQFVSLFALDVSTGAKVWQTPEAPLTSVAVADGKVFFGGVESYAFDALNGTKIWQYPFRCAERTVPAVNNGKVFFSGFDPKVVALDENTGAFVWEFTTGGTVYSSPATADGKVVVGSSDFKVYALDENTGTKVWEYDTGAGVLSSPAIADGKVFIGKYVLDLDTGALLWKYNSSTDIIDGSSSPAVVDGVVYIGSQTSGDLFALENSPVSDGNPCDTDWPMVQCNTQTRAESAGALPLPLSKVWEFNTGGDVDLAVVVSQGAVFGGSATGKLYSLDKKTGAQNWEYSTGGMVKGVAVDNNRVFAISSNNKITAVDRASGGFLWEFTSSAACNSAPIPADGSVYVWCHNANKVYALDQTTGALQWEYAFAVPFYASGVSVSDGKVFFGTSAGAFALNQTTGVKIWQNSPGVSTAPTVAAGKVFFGAPDKKVYAFDENAGGKIWEFTTGGTVYASPAVANGVVYAGSDDNKVYALDIETGAKIWDYDCWWDSRAAPLYVDGKVIAICGSYFHIIDAATGVRLQSINGAFLTANAAPAVSESMVYFGSTDDRIYAYEYQPVSPPSVLTATANCPDVNLTWTAASPATYDRYTVKRGTTAGGPYTQIATNISTTSYTDPNPGNGTYYYIVIAYKSTNPADQTGASNEASVTLNCSTSVIPVPCTTDWPTYMCNFQNSGTAVSTTAPPYRLKWESTLASSSIGSVAVKDGIAYVGTLGPTGTVQAFNAVTGAALWTRALGGSFNDISPTVANNMVYIGNQSNNKFYALNPTTGAIIWQQTLGVTWSATALYDGGFVYVGSGNSVYKLNAANGGIVWRVYPAGAGGDYFVDSAMSTHDGKVYIASRKTNDSRVYCLRMADGATVWQGQTENWIAGSSPVLFGDKVYYATAANPAKIVALKLADGAMAWQQSLPSTPFDATASVTDGKLFITDGDGYLRCFNPDTGAEIWNKQYYSGSFSGTPSPTYSNGHVFLGQEYGTNPKLTVFNANNGDIEWSTPARTYSSPAIADGRIYITTGNRIRCYEMDTAVPPSNLTATANCPDVNLTWTAASPASYDRYTVKRGTSSGGPYTQIATNISTTSYTDSNPGNGTYYYIVIAYKSTNPADQTPASNEASVTLNCGTTTNGSACGSDWPNFHCNNHNTGEGSTSISLPLSKKWEFTTNGEVNGGVSVVNGIAYVGSRDGKAYALNKDTGAKLWEFNAGGQVAFNPAVADGRVFFGSEVNKFYAVDAITGAKLWEFNTSHPWNWSAPSVSGDTVFFTGWDQKIHALNTVTGAEKWSYTFGSWSYSSPAVADGMVFTGSGDHNVYAFNETTGAKIWEFTTGEQVSSSPTVADGKVYIGSYDDKMYALDELTGIKSWEFTTGGDILSSPAVVNGVAYFGSGDGKMYALNSGTGAKIWETTIGAHIYPSPAVADGKVFTGSHNDKMYILDAANGAILWEYQAGNDVVGSPAVVDGVLYMTSRDHKVYAFEYQPTTPPAATATLNCPDVELTWTAASPASYDRYTVYRADASGGPYTQIATNISATSYTDAMPGQGLYYYVIEAYQSANPATKTGYSNEVYAEVDCDVTLNVSGTCNPVLSWDAAPAPLDRYTVSRSDTPGGPYTDIATNLSATDYTDTTALDNSTYYYVVTPYRSASPAKKADPSNEVSITTDCAPWDLVGEMHCPEIALIWQPSNGAQFNRYTVFRGTTSGGPYTQVATGLTAPGYTDAPPAGGQTYYYVVQAYENANPASKTGYSEEIMIQNFICPYPKPQNLSATLNCPDIDLTWDPVSTATGYNVYRATVSGGPYTRIDEGVTSPYADTTTVAGTTYYYVVTAFFSGQAGEESDYSNEAGITNSCSGVTIPKPPHPVSATPITGGITLNWTAPTQNTDNSPLTDLAGYKVYRSTTPGGPYAYQTTLGLTLTHTDSAVAAGTTYCYVLTAFDSEIPSNESAYSMEVCEQPDGVIPYTYDFDCGNSNPPHFSAPTPDGELYRPWEIATDASGYMYVTNSNNNRIEKFDKDCNFVAKWGTAGNLPGQITEPRGIVFSPADQRLYVTDNYSRIQAFTLTGAFSHSWSSANAVSLGVDTGGNIYSVRSTLGGMLTKYDASGNKLGEWTIPGIKGIAVDGSGTMYVTASNRVLVLDSGGVQIDSFGLGELQSPAGIHISPDGRLFISDTGLRRVEIFATDGTWLQSVGAPGMASGQFTEPSDVWVLSNTELLVLDRQHDRVSKFSQ